MPSKQIFSSIKFSSTILEKRIRELAFLNKGIAIKLTDNTSKKVKEFLDTDSSTKMNLKGIHTTASVKKLIEEAGGSVEV